MHSVQATTESTPVPGDGVDVTRSRENTGVAAIFPVVRAPAGQTLTGVGLLQAWIYVPALDRYVRLPRADQDLVDLGGMYEGALEPVPITWTVGRLALVFRNLGVSGGTDPELDLMCLSPGGDEL
jgi:hypothetical protein